MPRNYSELSFDVMGYDTIRIWGSSGELQHPPILCAKCCSPLNMYRGQDFHCPFGCFDKKYGKQLELKL